MGDVGRRGSLARGDGEAVQSHKPTALVGLVCRGKKPSGALEIQRVLIGTSEIDFPPLAFDLKDDRCAQLRDLVPEQTLGEGYYRYEIRLLREGELIDEISREFIVVAPTAPDAGPDPGPTP